MSDHEEFHDLLNRHVDDELSDAEVRTLEEHLSSCSPCRELLKQLRDVRSLIFEVGAKPRIEADVLAPVHRRRLPRVLLHGAAALLLLALALFVFVRNDEHEADPGGARTVASRPTTPAHPVASLEVDAADGSVLAVKLPTKDPKIHVFWIYQATHTTDSTNGN